MKVILTHDVLAKKVAEKVSVEDKELRKVEQFFERHYDDYKERGNVALLKKKELEKIKPYIEKLNLSLEEKNFIQESKKAVRTRIIIFILSFTLVSVLFVSLGIFSYTKNQEAIREKEKLEEKETELSNKKADLDNEKKNIEETSNNLKKEIQDLEKQREQVDTIISEVEKTKQDNKEAEQKLKQKEEESFQKIKEARLALQWEFRR